MDEDWRRRISIHDISPREYMYFPKGILEQSKAGEFSLIEIIHILLAIGALGISFSFALTKNSILWSLMGYDIDFNRLLDGIPYALLGVLTAFIGHELSHKLTAQHYGLWSEFRMYTLGLLFSMFFAITTGFVFAAPGAVMFRGEPRIFEEGHIAAAGPTMNIIIGGLTLPFILFSKGLFSKHIGFICIINIILAVFDLLPLQAFDGMKIITWNTKVWLILFIASLILLILILPYITLVSTF
ncbi:MAG: site-2 protease family protein [Thermoplasmata archaeon]|mgnify:CR=1 FL=1|nr:MAG: site-2 protease family protein [Thermoplasmata archaeon]